MTYDEMEPGHRKTVTRALQNHAVDLIAESKRLIALGKGAMANKLVKEAGEITRDLVPIFDDQAVLDLEAVKGDKAPRNRGLMLTAGDGGGS